MKLYIFFPLDLAADLKLVEQYYKELMDRNKIVTKKIYISVNVFYISGLFSCDHSLFIPVQHFRVTEDWTYSTSPKPHVWILFQPLWPSFLISLFFPITWLHVVFRGFFFSIDYHRIIFYHVFSSLQYSQVSVGW